MMASADNMRTLQRLSYLRTQAGHRELTEGEQDELAEETTCIHCGGFHVRACPRVKRIAFHPQSAKVVEVEYWSSDQIDWTGVVFTDTASEEEWDGNVPVPLTLALKLTSGVTKEIDQGLAALHRLIIEATPQV